MPRRKKADRQNPEPPAVPRLMRPLPGDPDTDKTPGPKEQPPPPKLEKVHSSQVVGALSSFGTGWDDGIGKILAVPEELFFFRSETSRQYSSAENADLALVVHGLNIGRVLVPKADYGIVLYETAGTLYFVLFDAKRRLLVRERLMCYHEQPPERDWKNVRNAIDSALRLAESDKAKKEGLFAVFDGYAHLVKVEKSAPLFI